MQRRGSAVPVQRLFKVPSYKDPEDLYTPEFLYYTYQEVLDEYWETWKTNMERIKLYSLISEENCVQDWLVVNWGQEIPWTATDVGAKTKAPEDL
jgi:hypothetical protein